MHITCRLELSVQTDQHRDFSVDDEYFEAATVIYSYGADQFPMSSSDVIPLPASLTR